ncbi:YopX family protein [Bacillus sp. OK048]|uniref:YopX family protein n=1 Tax=Bacillus sp. OK048 TaxID=1882761 RepID=UPI000884D71D|nr:YopX family protein [Bacillus sp. OK048]SDM17947.1 phage uncharacterized protein TIGR01671 [Bacillus sp. OK048]
MREIKFRAWEKNLKEIIPVHNIDFEKKMINTESAWRFFNEIDLMQYTGLKDKNGKEIYEGDIVKVNTNQYGVFKVEVRFYQGEFGYMNMDCKQITPPDKWDKEYPITSSGWFMGGFSPLSGNGYAKHKPCNAFGELSDIEILGSIFQNPELLEVAE